MLELRFRLEPPEPELTWASFVFGFALLCVGTARIGWLVLKAR